MPQPRYLGDGIYATWDGTNVCLHRGRHDAPVAVYINDDNLQGLMTYIKDVQKERNSALTAVMVVHMDTPPKDKMS